MNWDRIISASAGVLATAAISVLIVKSCSEEHESNSIDEVRSEIADARKVIKEVGDTNKSLRDSVAMWRDSVDFYKKGLADCEKGKAAKETQKRTEPARPVVPTKPQTKDTVYVVGVKGSHDTNINLNDNARNGQNIVVQNAVNTGSKTQITLGNGATNSGNIVVNNGGSVKITADRQALDSLRIAVDSLKSNPKTAAASSVILIKKVKTYSRTR